MFFPVCGRDRWPVSSYVNGQMYDLLLEKQFIFIENQ